ncbi:TonB-dependent receptor [Caulobacter sp. RL271]|uniref:TonB-dependent receptor n=1 Tax=Caulobacter segnis TaxID=88688 RepID=A0ABY4ZY96_9CAUL|nr:TonB-dependent receptor [Caulobacter segnis]USQ97169.1 TonB-dependent receptor [Caulobacter segnis]
MNSTKGSARARLLTTTLLAGLAAVVTPVAIATMAVVAPTVANAQDYSSGSLVGTVRDSAGAPVSGAAVAVKSLDQGFTRSVTTDATGQFRIPLIPIGGYSVAISKEGYQATNDGNVRVGLGGSTAYSFTLASAGESVSEVVITATANPQLDFAATTKGLTVDIETLTKQAPIGRSLTAVVQLAPGALQGNASVVSTSPATPDFSTQPSIGGSSIAENAFYVNGLNITNFNTYVGGAAVPFDFYKSIEVKTGGYPAEFGRATGGVINAVTKSGSNDFKVALHGNFELNSLRDHSPDTYEYANHRSGRQNNSATIEVSGPIIEDHLFFYVLNQQQKETLKTAQSTNGQYVVDTTNDPFWGGKLDGYITDKQRVELTYFDTTRTTNRKAFSYNSSTDTIGAALPPTTYQLGGQNWVGRYTGTFTDWFTLSAAYGKSKDRTNTLPADTTSPRVRSDVSATNPLVSGPTRTISNQKSASYATLSTEREFYRIDGDLYFNLMGSHHVRTGYDHEKTTLNHAQTSTGGIGYFYHVGSASDARGVAAGVPYVEVSTQRLGGAPVHGINAAYYVQDAWDITKGLTLQLGIRNDKFTLGNLAGETVLDFKNNWGPRLGFTWDPVGDGANKVFGSYGRYFIPPASNLSYRGADLGYSAFFYAPTAAGFAMNPTTMAPTALGTQITATTNPTGTFTYCPLNNPVAGSPGVKGCAVPFGVGVPEPAASKTAQGLKATYEDEFTVGYERRFNTLWKGGVSLTYRALHRVSEDMTLDPYIRQYCASRLTGAALTACNTVWNNSWQYIVFNPGEDLTIKLRAPNSAVHSPETIAALNGALPATLTFTKQELGFPTVKREYVGLEFNFERAFDGKWGLQGSYVLSESKGNYEGTVLSDNAQTDAGSTILFDFQHLADYQYGLLPNHRAHQFKLFGTYALTDNLMLGANGTLLSPRHQGCLGLAPYEGDPSQDYGASARYCGGKPAPRGKGLKTDWVKTLDLSLRYTLPDSIVPANGNLVLRADVFNIFNSKAVNSREEAGETDNGSPYVDDNDKPLWGAPIAYQTPRYVRLGFDLAF